jgi:hypothetical protein
MIGGGKLMKTKKAKEIEELKKELNKAHLQNHNFVHDLYFSNTTKSKERFEKVWVALVDMGVLVSHEKKKKLLEACFKSPIFYADSSILVDKSEHYNEHYKVLVPEWKKKTFETTKDKQKFLRYYKKNKYVFVESNDYFWRTDREMPSRQNKVFTYFEIESAWVSEVFSLLSEYQESHFWNNDKLSRESDWVMYHKKQAELVDENAKLRRKLNDSLVLPKKSYAISSLLWDFKSVYEKLANLNSEVSVAKMNGISATDMESDSNGNMRWKETGELVVVQDGDIVWENKRVVEKINSDKKRPKRRNKMKKSKNINIKIKKT